jgi:hypothetical protein
MATYSANSSATGGTFQFENRYATMRYTIGAAGETTATMSVWIRETTTNNAHPMKGICIRSSDGVVIEAGTERQDIQTGSLTEYTFTFPLASSLSNVDYDFGLFIGAGGGTIDWEADTTTGTARLMIVAGYPTLSDPASWTTFTGTLRMTVVTNDPGGGSAFPSPIYQAMMLS